MDRRLSIVVADDVEDLRRLIRHTLERSAQFDVVAEAGDGVEAIRKVEIHQPDIALLDLSMPGMHGLSVLPHIRRVCPTAMVTIFSALVDPDLKRRGLELGAFAFINKGDTISRLPATLRSLHADHREQEVATG